MKSAVNKVLSLRDILTIDIERNLEIIGEATNRIVKIDNTVSIKNVKKKLIIQINHQQ